MASDGIDFIDEDDARRILLALLEQIAHAARADANEHLHEIRTGDREKRNARLTGNRARKKRFTGSRRTDQQNAFRNAAAELLKFLRLAQELDNFLKLFLGLLHAGHVLKRDLL